MHMVECAKHLLEADYRTAVDQFDPDAIEEIRLRIGRPPHILMDGREVLLDKRRVQERDMYRLLEVATEASIHTAAPMLAEGFLTYHGLRVGVCGTAIIRDGVFSGFRSYTSAAIRIPMEHPGICDAVANKLMENGFESTLILSPPGGGKTTALREIIRKLSQAGYRVGVADDRNELAFMNEGYAQLDLGEHCDVITGAEKARAAMMLLRGMNPQIIAMDEISSEKDMLAVEQLFGCGVSILASAHAAGPADLKRRDMYKHILDRHIFQYLVTITGAGSGRQYAVARIER